MFEEDVGARVRTFAVLMVLCASPGAWGCEETRTSAAGEAVEQPDAMTKSEASSTEKDKPDEPPAQPKADALADTKPAVEDTVEQGAAKADGELDDLAVLDVAIAKIGAEAKRVEEEEERKGNEHALKEAYQYVKTTSGLRCVRQELEMGHEAWMARKPGARRECEDYMDWLRSAKTKFRKQREALLEPAEREQLERVMAKWAKARE